MGRFLLVVLLIGVIVLVAWSCSRGDGPTSPILPPVFKPGPTQTARVYPSPFTATHAPPTATRTPTRIPSPTPTRTATPTSTPLPPPQINVLIRTCDTGIDIFNGLGEVTNAYVSVQNVGQGAAATGVQVTLSASDEEEAHPNKSYLVGYLPAGNEIALKVTVDTENGTPTSITVTVTSAEGIEVTAEEESCRSRRPDQDVISKLGELFVVRPIPGE